MPNPESVAWQHSSLTPGAACTAGKEQHLCLCHSHPQWAAQVHRLAEHAEVSEGGRTNLQALLVGCRQLSVQVTQPALELSKQEPWTFGFLEEGGHRT